MTHLFTDIGPFEFRTLNKISVKLKRIRSRILFYIVVSMILIGFCAEVSAWGPVTHIAIAKDVINDARAKIDEINNKCNTHFELDENAYYTGALAPDIFYSLHRNDDDIISAQFFHEYAWDWRANKTLGLNTSEQKFSDKLYESAIKKNNAKLISFVLGWKVHLESDKAIDLSFNDTGVNFNEGICVRLMFEAISYQDKGSRRKDLHLTEDIANLIVETLKTYPSYNNKLQIKITTQDIMDERHTTGKYSLCYYQDIVNTAYRLASGFFKRRLILWVAHRKLDSISKYSAHKCLSKEDFNKLKYPYNGYTVEEIYNKYYPLSVHYASNSLKSLPGE